MRALSSRMLAALAGENTDDVVCVLLVLEHADLATPIRVVSNTDDVTSNGHTYTAFPFSVTLPFDREDQIPAAAVTFDNVAREIVAAFGPLTGDVTATLSVVLAATPDTLEYGPVELTLRFAPYDALVVNGVLAAPPLLDEPFPPDTFTPDKWPGLFP